MASAVSVDQSCTVGWLCALKAELEAAKAMFDGPYETRMGNGNDNNVYFVGPILHHQVVITCLPSGRMGTNAAAMVTTRMMAAFPNIKIGLMVGIGGGLPGPQDDIRLGDVVVSRPVGQFGGVVQYDMGKIRPGGFERIGSLNAPPERLLSLLNLMPDHGELFTPHPVRLYPGSELDRLYRAEYEHVGGKTCQECDDGELEARDLGDRDTRPRVFYGGIASGNSLIKDTVTRNKLKADHGVLCCEMEAAGLMNSSFPCLVIRGISDYATLTRTISGNPMQQLQRRRLQKAFSWQSRKRLFASWNRSQMEVLIMQHLYESSPEYDLNRDMNLKLRAPNTCEWILENEQYQQWWNETGTRVLWISANPGSGKSVLAAYLAHRETSCLSCHFFFKNDDDKQNNAISALCALLHQIFDKKRRLRKYAAKKVESKGMQALKEFGTLWEILNEVAKDSYCGKMLCILDGLDECEETGRSRLMKALVGLDHSPGDLKFMVTSRPYSTIAAAFDKSSILRIKDTTVLNEINVDIKRAIESELSSLVSDGRLEPRLRDTVEQRVINNADHTFLWVSLILGRFKRDGFEGRRIQYMKVLDNLPPDLDAIYEGMLTQSSNPKKARKILQILVAATRPLRVSEMDIALAVRIEHRSSEDIENNRYPSLEIAERSIRDYTGLLVKLVGNGDDKKIFFIHRTAKEFLVRRSRRTRPDRRLWKHSLDLLEANSLLAEVCIGYIMLERLDPYPSKTDYNIKSLNIERAVNEYTDRYGFLEYAASHWAGHFRNVNSVKEETMLRSKEVCDVKSERFLIWFQIYWTKIGSIGPYPTGFTSLIVGSYFGLQEIVKLLLQERADVTQCDNDGKTALHWAAEMGHMEVVRLLLERVAIVPREDYSGKTPLHWAAYQSHNSEVVLLLAEAYDIMATDNHGVMALHLASTSGDKGIVSLILDIVPNAITATSASKRTALHYAAANGHTSVVQLLLDRKIDVNAEDIYGVAALHLAVKNGQGTVVRQLLENGAGAVEDSRSRQSALEMAAEQGNEAMVLTILQNATNDISRTAGLTALHEAADKGHDNIVRLLLRNGFDSRARDSNGATALHRASKGGHVAVVLVLLEMDTDLDIEEKNNDSRTVLHCASMSDIADVARILLEHGADIEARDNNGMSPLHWAAATGSLAVTSILLNWHANEAARSKPNWTPLQYAVNNGRGEVVRLLLPEGADTEVANDMCLMFHQSVKYGMEIVVRLLLAKGADVKWKRGGRTVLFWAAANGNQTIVDMLLRAGADITTSELNSAAENGHEPIFRLFLEKKPKLIEHIEQAWFSAAANGHPPVMQLILSKDVNVNYKSTVNRNRTALHAAAERGQYSVVGLLLDRGAQVNSITLKGQTPLHVAAEMGQYSVVGLLLDRGAQVNSITLKGQTPLHVAAEMGQYSVVGLLLDRGAQVNSLTLEDQTPLHAAAERGQYSVVGLLLDRGAQVNSITLKGQTPLHAATEMGQYSVVRLLLDRGAKANSTISKGRTPLHTAAGNGHHIILELLLKRGLNAADKDSRGRTALHFAAGKGRPEEAKLLLNYGADADSQDQDGLTALHWAARNGHYRVVSLLLSAGANVTAEDRKSRTPLYWASKGGYTDTEQLLQDHISSLVNT